MNIKKIKTYILIIIFLFNINNTYSKNIINNIKAKSFILVDYNSKKILIQKNQNKKLYPASLTKIMTSYILTDLLKSKKKKNKNYTIIKNNAWSKNKIFKNSSLMFLNKNEKVKITDLNKGMIIQSGNDACVAISEYIAKKEKIFIKLMNKYAKNIGLKNTKFNTVHGLDNKKQYTTAKDMVKLSILLIKNFPKEYKIYKKKFFIYNGIKQNNRNKLLWNKKLNIDGIKTGHTEKAGYNLIISAIKGKRRLILVILGNKTIQNRDKDSIKLLKWGFKKYYTYRIIKSKKNINKIKKKFIGTNKNIYITNKKKYTIKKHIYYKIFKINNLFTKKYQITGKIFYLINKKKNKKCFFLISLKEKKNNIFFFIKNKIKKIIKKKTI